MILKRSVLSKIKSEDKNVSPMIDPDILKISKYSDSFWYLWPIHSDEDLPNIYSPIVKDNLSRKERYQRAICRITKSEYVMFTALLLDDTVHSINWEKLWNAMLKKKQKWGLL